jgi:enoyl-CoA hydratase/carnithine racemase
MERGMLDRIGHGNILELKLNRPPVNAMDPGLVCHLRDEVIRAPKDGARALIFSGRDGLFSGGLDLGALLQLDRSGISQFFDDFYGMLKTVAASPIPIATALTGHAPAGGAVLSLFTDYRVMAEGEYRFGFNEVAVGLVVPEQVRMAAARIVGLERAERICVEASMMKPTELLSLGLVHELAPVAETVARAKAWCERILAFPPLAMAKMRRHARADLIAVFDDNPRHRDFMMEHWFSEEAQATMHQVMERLKAGRKKA